MENTSYNIEDPSHAEFLTTVTQITSAAQAGKLSINISGVVLNCPIDSVSITLNHVYSEKKIISSIESTWPKTIDTLTKELQRKGISSEHITMICDVADNNAEKILKCRLDKQAEKEKEEENNHKQGETSQRAT